MRAVLLVFILHLFLISLLSNDKDDLLKLVGEYIGDSILSEMDLSEDELKIVLEGIKKGANGKVDIEKVGQNSEKIRFYMNKRKEEQKQKKLNNALESDELILIDRNGNKIKMKDLLTGDNIVLVDFWAEWCLACIESMPDLMKFNEDFLKTKGVKLVGIGLTTKENADKIFSKIQPNFDWYYVEKPEGFMGLFQMEVLPHQLLIGKNKHVYFSSAPNEKKIKEIIESLK